MLTLLINVSDADENFAEHHLKILENIAKLEKNFEVVFLAKQNHQMLEELKYLASKVVNHSFLIGDEKTTDDEMIQMGLEYARGNDVLICTSDTLPDVLYKILEKKNEGRKIVYARRKTNKFQTFFRNLGIWAYNFGLKLLGKNSDNFSEVRIQYFDQKIAFYLSENVKNNRELRITNSFKQQRTGIVECEKLYINEDKKNYKEKVMFGLGWVTAFYILALLALLVIYPCFNQMTYSWWMVVAIVIWVVFGILAILSASKKIYKSRCGVPLRTNEMGERTYNLVSIVEFGDKIENKILSQKPQKAVLKSNKYVKIVKKQSKTLKNNKKPKIKGEK